MAQDFKKGFVYNLLPSFFETWNRLRILILIALLNCNLHVAIALTQSHQGSATTNEFTLNGASPNARIQIVSSSTVHVVNVEPPSPAGSENLDWKVSLELLALQLCEPVKPGETFGGDILKVVYSDPTSIKTYTWKLNASYTSQNDIEGENELRELDNIQANQIVLISEGRWVLSKADLVATLYHEPFENGTCSEDMFLCSCTSSNKNNPNRCIPKTLVCNGHPNCGFGCTDDESKCSGTTLSTSLPLTSCVPTPEVSTTAKPPSGSGNGAMRVTPVSSASAICTILFIIFLAR